MSLTNGQLDQYSKEIDELGKTMELCSDCGRDSDVIEYCEARLDEIDRILTESMNEISKPKLRLVAV